jgi:hypothetical protein
MRPEGEQLRLDEPDDCDRQVLLEPPPKKEGERR